MGEINILHLSDIHFKKDMAGKYPPYPEKVGQWLVEAIRKHVDKEENQPDVVAVTGDIASFPVKNWSMDRLPHLLSP